MIKPNLVKKVIIDKDQLFVLHKVLGSLTETPVGKYAILTNKGIILHVINHKIKIHSIIKSTSQFLWNLFER